jgi:hypothetical protein
MKKKFLDLDYPYREMKNYIDANMKKNKGMKTNKGKLRWSLLPFEVLKDVVKVFMSGSKKYADDNWRINVKENPRYYYDALMRHYEELHTDRFEKSRACTTIDKDSGLPTLAHIIANGLILLWYQKRGGK